MSPPCEVTTFGTLRPLSRQPDPVGSANERGQIRSCDPNLIGNRENLGHEERQDLSPATLPAAQVLKNRVVCEVPPPFRKKADGEP